MKNHVKYRASFSNATLYVELWGQFNLIDVQGYIEEVKSIITELNGKPFLYLFNNISHTSGTPEVYEEINTFHNWLSQQNLVAKANVYLSPSLKGTDSAHLTSHRRFRCKFFEHIEEAKSWLGQYQLSYSHDVVQPYQIEELRLR